MIFSLKLAIFFQTSGTSCAINEIAPAVAIDSGLQGCLDYSIIGRHNSFLGHTPDCVM